MIILKFQVRQQAWYSLPIQISSFAAFDKVAVQPAYWSHLPGLNLQDWHVQK